jgi:Tat protein translocase TatB subunit
MFGIGYQEMFVVLVVALVIFGPSRLPELAGQVGRWVRDFRRMSADLTGEFEKTFAEVDEVKKTFKRELEGIQEEVEGIGKSAKKDLKRASARTDSGTKKSPTGATKTTVPARAASARSTAPVLAAKADGVAAATNGAATATSAPVSGTSLVSDGLPRATKADPLLDVSFFDTDIVVVPAENGAMALANGPADDALQRVRRRRAASAYSRRAGVS